MRGGNPEIDEIDNQVQGLIHRFAQLFDAVPRIFQAPGRVNLIGEHTDYNDGFVMPAAIGFCTRVAAAPRQDRKLVVRSENFAEQLEFNLDALPDKRSGHWSDYVIGVAKALSYSSSTLIGANLLIEGDVPQGAGLSSSASLEVAVGYALLDVARRCDRPHETRIAVPKSRERVCGCALRNHGPVYFQPWARWPRPVARLPLARTPAASNRRQGSSRDLQHDGSPQHLGR